MYKIYIKDTLLVLIDSKDLDQTKNKLGHGLISRYTGKKKTLLNYVDSAEKGGSIECFIIYSDNLKSLWRDFKSIFRIEKAGGGLVLNKKKEGLLIFRRGFWDLPKGKFEKNEKKKAGAIREVQEETGVKNVVLEGKLATTYHTYKANPNNRVLKKTYWYLMHSTDTKLIPQAEEDIEIAKWYNLDKFQKIDEPVHENIRELISYYMNAVRNSG